MAWVLHNTVGAFVYLSYDSHDLDQRQLAGTPASNAFELGPGVLKDFPMIPGQKLYAMTTAAASVRLSVEVHDNLEAVRVEN